MVRCAPRFGGPLLITRARSPRENLALRTAEVWQPPAFVKIDGPAAKLKASVRRFFDLQAGSIWRDLSTALGSTDGLVVDVGCGAQPYRGLLPRTAQYIGLDTEDSDDHFGYAMPDVSIIGSDGSWPLADASADVVLATETLEHVPDPDAFLAEAARVLRPGGRLILTVPFAARWHYVPHDYWRFTPSGLGLILGRAGFTDVVVNGRGNAATVACYKTMALILTALLPQSSRGAVRLRLSALPLLPLLLLLAIVGNRTLSHRAGDDCLGYTTLALKASTTSVGAVS